MSKNIFVDIVKKLGDESTNFLDEALNSAEFSGYIDTGSYALNAQLSGSIYGGFPNNKALCFAGESTTGKTFFALGIVKNFLDDNPDGAVFYFDTETAVTRKMMRDRGVDSSRVIVSEPETVQEYRHTTLQILDNYMKIDPDERPSMMMVLDSLGNLSTTKELEDSSSGAETRDMTRAQVLRATFRTIRLKLAKAAVPLIINNHTYEKVGAYVPTKVASGGGGPKYAADIIAMLSKQKLRDNTDKKIVLGNIIRVVLDKSRFTKEQSRIEVLLTYDKGLDRYYGLVPMALAAGIWTKGAKQIEINGKKVYESAINKNPKKYFTEDVLTKIEEYVPQIFCYGKDESEFVDNESD